MLKTPRQVNKQLRIQRQKHNLRMPQTLKIQLQMHQTLQIQPLILFQRRTAVKQTRFKLIIRLTLPQQCQKVRISQPNQMLLLILKL